MSVTRPKQDTTLPPIFKNLIDKPQRDVKETKPQKKLRKAIQYAAPKSPSKMLDPFGK